MNRGRGMHATHDAHDQRMRLPEAGRNSPFWLIDRFGTVAQLLPIA